MTFLRYSKLTSSSLLLVIGDSGREAPGDRGDAGEIGVLASGVLAKPQ